MTNRFIIYLLTRNVPVTSRLTLFSLGVCLLFYTTLSSPSFHPGHRQPAVAESNSLAALMPVPQTLELRGNLIAQSDKVSVQTVTYVLAQGSARTPIDLAANTLAINYRDANQRLSNLTWQWEFLDGHDQDTLLEAGELVRITVPLADSLVHPLAPNMPFVLDLIPPTGALLVLKSQTPAQLETSTALILR